MDADTTHARLPPALAGFVARHHVSVEVVAADEAAPTAAAAARILGVDVGDIVKTLVLTDGVACVAAIVPGDRRLDRRKLAQAAGCGTLRFASAAEVVERTGFPPGGVAPLGFAGPVTVVVDAALATPPGRTVVAGGGRAELLVRLAVADIVRCTAAHVAPIARDDA